MEVAAGLAASRGTFESVESVESDKAVEGRRPVADDLEIESSRSMAELEERRKVAAASETEPEMDAELLLLLLLVLMLVLLLDAFASQAQDWRLVRRCIGVGGLPRCQVSM